MPDHRRLEDVREASICMREKPLSRKPFLSICITSYNRIHELYRCLQSVDTAYTDLIEIVVSEDCSPKRDAIAHIVERFASETRYSVIYHSNVENLGFDRNFGKLIDLASGEFLLFMTDDDTFCEGALDQTIDALQGIDCAVAFSPFVYNTGASDPNTGLLERKYGSTMLIPRGINSVNKYLYCSILLSGLVFKRSAIAGHSAERFKNLIYSQVYLFASVLFKNDGFYIDVPLVQYTGDGENAFGLNDSGEKNPLLSDRHSIYSGLEFHKGLIKIVGMFDSENGTDLMKSFAREYSLKAYSGLYIARKAGRRELINYWKKMKSLNIKLSLIAGIYYWALRLLGIRVCDSLVRFPKNILLGIRRRRVA